MKPLRYVLLCLLAGCAVSPSAPDTTGEIISAHGKVFLLKEGTRMRIPVSPRHIAHPGDTYQTASGSQMQISLGSGGTLLLQPESRMIISASSPDTGLSQTLIRLRLETGGIELRAGTAKRRIEIRTPLAVIRTAGADFTTYADDESTRVTVTEGKVSLLPSNSQCQREQWENECDEARILSAKPDHSMLVLKKGETVKIVPAGEVGPEQD